MDQGQPAKGCKPREKTPAHRRKSQPAEQTTGERRLECRVAVPSVAVPSGDRTEIHAKIVARLSES